MDIKIVEYKDLDDNITNEIINDFINVNMNYFLGREFKRREDIINIENYYIKNGGNFWVAIDKKHNIIVGTIAVEVKDGKGVLKRFYVDKDYHNKGIGTELYKTFEKYVIENTNVRILYLSCGKVLKDTHRFYENRGWKQIDTLEIEITTHKEIVDYFKKVL